MSLYLFFSLQKMTKFCSSSQSSFCDCRVHCVVINLCLPHQPSRWWHGTPSLVACGVSLDGTFATDSIAVVPILLSAHVCVRVPYALILRNAFTWNAQSERPDRDLRHHPEFSIWSQSVDGLASSCWPQLTQFTSEYTLLFGVF